MNNLAVLYWLRNQYDQAELLYIEILAIRKRELGAHARGHSGCPERQNRSSRIATRPYWRFAYHYAIPLAITSGYCVVAHRRGCRLIWPLAACLILAFYVGGTALRIDTPMLQISRAQLGFGRHDLLLSPALLGPPAAFMCYLMIRSWMPRRILG